MRLLQLPRRRVVNRLISRRSITPCYYPIAYESYGSEYRRPRTRATYVLRTRRSEYYEYVLALLPARRVEAEIAHARWDQDAAGQSQWRARPGGRGAYRSY